MSKKRKEKVKREPVCTECSHPRVSEIDDPRTLHPSPARLQRYPLREWRWWLCSYCNSVWVVRSVFDGVKLRIGYLDDATFAWHDVSRSP